MDTVFRGFAPEVFEWFAGLERDNSKAYFTATRDLYVTEVRGGLETMLDELSEAFGGDVQVFRQQRDLRFTRDKSPYKATTYGILQGAPGAAAGLYAQLSSRGSTPARATTNLPVTSSNASATPSSMSGLVRGSPRRPPQQRLPGSTWPGRACARRRAATRATIPGSSC